MPNSAGITQPAPKAPLLMSFPEASSQKSTSGGNKPPSKRLQHDGNPAMARALDKFQRAIDDPAKSTQPRRHKMRLQAMRKAAATLGRFHRRNPSDSDRKLFDHAVQLARTGHNIPDDVIELLLPNNQQDN